MAPRLRLGGSLGLAGVLLLAAGLLFFPDSNLLGGLGPLGGVCLQIGLVVTVVSRFARRER